VGEPVDLPDDSLDTAGEPATEGLAATVVQEVRRGRPEPLLDLVVALHVLDGDEEGVLRPPLGSAGATRRTALDPGPVDLATWAPAANPATENPTRYGRHNLQPAAGRVQERRSMSGGCSQVPRSSLLGTTSPEATSGGTDTTA
jgi:hypothetical protein